MQALPPEALDRRWTRAAPAISDRTGTASEPCGPEPFSMPPSRRSARSGTAVCLADSDSDARNLQFQPRAHARAQADAFDIRAFDARRLRPADRPDEGAHVLDQRLFAEAHLADPGMDDARLLGAKLDLAALRRPHRLGDVRGNRAQLRVRH